MRKALIMIMCLTLVCSMVHIAKADKEAQPHMKSAMAFLVSAKNERVGEGKIRHLQSAKAELNMATADKCGHRVAAIRAIDNALEKINAKKFAVANNIIDNAIHQVRKGIACDNKR